MTIHYGEKEKNWTISKSGYGWIPGVYDSERAARYAFRLPDDVLQRLQDQAGPGGVITLEALRSEKKRSSEKS